MRRETLGPWECCLEESAHRTPEKVALLGGWTMDSTGFPSKAPNCALPHPRCPSGCCSVLLPGLEGQPHGCSAVHCGQ